jgi:hypothetical protein
MKSRCSSRILDLDFSPSLIRNTALQVYGPLLKPPISGYANQMFSEDDLPADTILVGADNEPIILDRLQVLFFALNR